MSKPDNSGGSGEQKTKFFRTKGFYIALVVLTTAIGIYAVLSALTAKTIEENTFDEQAWNDSQAEIMARNEVEDLNGDDDQKGFERVDSIPVNANQYPVEAAVEATATAGLDDNAEDTGAIANVEPQASAEAFEDESTSQPAESAQPIDPESVNISELMGGMSFAMPLDGTITKEYSMNDLQYSETMQDWRTHEGIDIEAELGTPVLAAAAGSVVQVYEDPMLGYTVVIRHENNMETVYANLQDMPQIEPVDQVTAGQEIGRVGATAMTESVEPPHLHFEVRYMETKLDPKECLGLGASAGNPSDGAAASDMQEPPPGQSGAAAEMQDDLAAESDVDDTDIQEHSSEQADMEDEDDD